MGVVPRSHGLRNLWREDRLSPTSIARARLVELEKRDLFTAMQTEKAREARCCHCGLPIFTFDTSKHPKRREPVDRDPQRWYHFSNMKQIGARPFGKNEPLYDLSRSCVTALRHLYTIDSPFDERASRERLLKRMLASRLKYVTPSMVATPS